MAKAAEKHDVHRDYVGINPRIRFTCFSEGCGGATLIRQPWMNGKEWEKRRSEYSNLHPCDKIKDDGFQG
jgi:hypothetical protein